jgi:hypothetical protein
MKIIINYKKPIFDDNSKITGFELFNKYIIENKYIIDNKYIGLHNMLLYNFITLHIDLINSKINKKKHRICLNKDCKTEACFNYKNYKDINIKKNIYCSKHKLTNMINVKDKRCKFENCNKIPSYNFHSENKALYCVTHKLNNMINIKSKKCKYINCNIQPIYGYKNNTNILYCKLHKEFNMIDIKNKLCIYDNCITQSVYGFKNDNSPKYCSKHKLTNMINIKDKKCKFENCNKIPNYNFKDIKSPIYCNVHKLENMINVKDNRCKTELCDIIAAKKHLKGYCLRCFIYNFPNDKLIRDYGTREAKVSEFIKEMYPNLNINYNKTIKGGCSSHRPDIFIDCITHSVIIEVDENQHKAKKYNTECEIRRINNLFTDLADRPIIFIRFNPDSYTNIKNKLIKSCFEYTKDKELPKANKTLQIRLKKLKEVIDNNLTKASNENILIIKLYYDGY